MAEVIVNAGIVREAGFRYFVDGNVNVVKQDRKTKENTVVFTSGITAEKGYMYVLDAQGNIARATRKPRAPKAPAATPVPTPTAA